MSDQGHAFCCLTLKDENVQLRTALTESRREVERLKADMVALGEPMACGHALANSQPCDDGADACIVCAEIEDKSATLRRQVEEQAGKLAQHEHCVTPCDSIRIQSENHSAYTLMKDRAEQAEKERDEWKAAASGRTVSCVCATRPSPSEKALRGKVLAIVTDGVFCDCSWPNGSQRIPCTGKCSRAELLAALSSSAPVSEAKEGE